MEFDGQHRTLFEVEVRTARDQGTERQLSGPEETEGLWQNRRHQEKEKRCRIGKSQGQSCEKAGAQTESTGGVQPGWHGATEKEKVTPGLITIRTRHGRCKVRLLHCESSHCSH